MVRSDEMEEQLQGNQSGQSTVTEADMMPSCSTSSAPLPARFYYHDKFILMYKSTTGETCIDEVTGKTSFKEVTRFQRDQGWTSILTYKHSMGAYLLSYKVTTGEVELGQLTSTGQIEHPIVLHWEPGWTSITSLHIKSHSFLIKSSAESLTLIFMQITPENSFIEVSRTQTDKNWTSMVTYAVNKNYYLLSYHSETGSVRVSFIANNENKFSLRTVKDFIWTSGWSSITSYFYKGNTYLFMVKSKTGEVCVDQITINGTPKFARWYNWRPNWTTCVALCPSLPVPQDSRGLVIERQELIRHNDYSNTDFRDARFHEVDIGNNAAMYNNRPVMDYTIFDGATLVSVRGKQASLKGSQMLCTVLTNCHFEHADLSYSNLSTIVATECNFTSANLLKVNLDNATLTHCHFEHACLNYSNLSAIVATDCSFASASLLKVNLDNARLIRINMLRANLAYASLVNTNITETDILSCRSLDYVDLSKTIGDITGKYLPGQLIQTNFNNKRIINVSFISELYKNKFNKSIFIGCEFNGANTEYTTFISAIFTQCTFKKRQITEKVRYSDGRVSGRDTYQTSEFIGANFSYATFNESFIDSSNFTESSFNYAIMNGIRISNSAWGGPSMQFRDVTFSSCTFIGVSMKNSELIGLNFSSLNFENANLTNASLKVVNFSKANLRGAILIGIHSQYSETTLDKVMNFLAYRSCTLNLNYANLKNANLSNAVLIGATLKNTILVGADLRGANLSHADLSNAIIDKTTKLDGTILTNAKINWLYYEQLSKAEQNKINDINNYWTRKLNKQHNNSHSFAISLTHAPSNEQRASVSLPLTQHQSLSVTGLFASSSQDSSPSHTPVEAALSIQNDNLPHIYTNEIKISHPYFKVTRVNSTNRSLYQFDMRGLASVLDSEQQFRLQEAIRSETIWPYQQGFIESDRYFRELNLGDIRAAQYLLQILGDLLNLPADNLQLLDDVATEDTAYQSKAAMSYSPPSIALSDIPSARPKSPEQQLSHNSPGLLYHNELTAEPLSHQQLSTNTSDSDSDEVESTKNNSDADNLRFH